LGKFHLQFALAGACAPRKNIQNKLGAVNDLEVKRAFEVTKLSGRQIVSEDDTLGSRGAGCSANLLYLAAPDEGCGIRFGRALEG